MSENLSELDDARLIARARVGGDEAERCLDVLYRRYYPKVSGWCLRICGDRDRAADLAQEVFVRVHDRLDSFRAESRFSTWLYSVTRSVAINRGISERRRHTESLDLESQYERTLVDPTPDALDKAETRQIVARFRQAMERDLKPLEIKVLYLHHVHGMTLDGITSTLKLENKSGAKAYLVAAKRKLTRRFGRWLAAQSRTVEASESQVSPGFDRSKGDR